MRLKVVVFIVFLFCMKGYSVYSKTGIDSLLASYTNTSLPDQQSLILLKMAESVSTPDSVILFSNWALKLAEKAKDDSLKLIAYSNLVRGYLYKPFSEDSGLVYIPLIDRINQDHDFHEWAHISNSVISSLYLQLHQYDFAIKYSQKSYEASRLLGDETRICKAKNALGECYRKASLFNDARDVFQEAVDLALMNEDLLNIVKGYRGIAICYDMTKDFLQAEKYFQLSLDYALKANNEKSVYAQYGNLAVAQWHSLKYDAAIVNLHKAVVIAKKYNLAGIQTDYKNLADVYKDKGDPDSAIYYGNLSLSLAEKNNEKLLQSIVHRILTDSYKLAGDHKMALVHAEKAQVLSDSLKSKERDKAIAEAAEAYKTKENKSKIELLNKENEIQRLILKEKEAELLYASIRSEQNQSEIEILNKDKSLQLLELSKSQQEIEFRRLKEQATKNELELAKKDRAIKERQMAEQVLFRNIVIVSILVLLLFSFVLFNRYRLAIQLKAQKALTTQRKQISADLHDDIGATLSSISIYSEAMKNKVESGDYTNAVQLADKIGDNSREMVGNMSDIVWAISPGNDTLQQLFDRMVVFAMDLFEEKNISCKYEFDPAIQAYSIPMDARKNIYLIYKEAINNLSKYSRCNNVSIQMMLNNQSLILKVTDDGIGFNPETIISRGSDLNGNGIRNMKQRAREINAQLDLITASNQGTSIILTYPLFR